MDGTLVVEFTRATRVTVLMSSCIPPSKISWNFRAEAEEFVTLEWEERMLARFKFETAGFDVD